MVQNEGQEPNRFIQRSNSTKSVWGDDDKGQKAKRQMEGDAIGKVRTSLGLFKLAHINRLCSTHDSLKGRENGERERERER